MAFSSTAQHIINSIATDSGRLTGLTPKNTACPRPVNLQGLKEHSEAVQAWLDERDVGGRDIRLDNGRQACEHLL
jgi:hypothetical protein